MKVLVPATSSALGLSLDSVDELVRLARAGVPNRELAVHASCALSTVYEHLGAATLVLRHHRAAHHLRVEEREEIRAGIVRGDSLRAIARALRRNVSCVSREVERNRRPQPTEPISGPYGPPGDPVAGRSRAESSCGG